MQAEGLRISFRGYVLCVALLLLFPSHALAAKSENAVIADFSIPQRAIDSLASGNLNEAVILLREGPKNPKQLYLLREASRIVKFELGKKPSRNEAHKVYQNVGVGYHNLYLFLKTRGIEQEEYLKAAHKYYRKARSAGTVFHKEESDILEAALFAASGNMEKAQKKFKKVDETLLRGDFESMEYLATYHASAGNLGKALDAIEDAYRLNPDRTLAWLAVGDDFFKIKDEPRFKTLEGSLRTRHGEEAFALTIPSSKEPSFELTGSRGSFMPQKEMPRYKKRRRRKK